MKYNLLKHRNNLFQRFHKYINFFPGIIESKRSTHCSLNSKMIHQGIGAMVAGSDSYSEFIEHGSQIKEIVGYGVTANCFEGGGPTPAPSNTASVQRTSPGFDTDNNNTDFATLTPPTPTNSGIDVTPPTISSLSPANLATGVAPSFSATITFSETVQKGTGNIVLKKISDNSIIQTIDVTNLPMANIPLYKPCVKRSRKKVL